MKMDPVIDARRDILFLIAGAERPGVPFSTKKPRTLPFSPFSTTRAQMTNKSATGALEIQVLLPLRTQPSDVLVAVVSIEEGSEPWLGSVRPYYTKSAMCNNNVMAGRLAKQPITSPVAMKGQFINDGPRLDHLPS